MAVRGGSGRLAWLINEIDSYGEAIEYDLHDRFGLDLLDFLRGRYTLRKLAALVERLPLASQYWQTKANDPAYGDLVVSERERLKALGEDTPEPLPALSEWTPERSQLTEITDLLNQLIVTTVAVNGQRPPPVQAQPRPMTAVRGAEERAERAQFERLMAEATDAQKRYPAYLARRRESRRA